MLLWVCASNNKKNKERDWGYIKSKHIVQNERIGAKEELQQQQQQSKLTHKQTEKSFEPTKQLKREKKGT